MKLYYPIIGTGSGSVRCYIILNDPCLLCYIVLPGVFQRVMELEADAVHHELIYVDKAGLKNKVQWQKHNLTPCHHQCPAITWWQHNVCGY